MMNKYSFSTATTVVAAFILLTVHAQQHCLDKPEGFQYCPEEGSAYINTCLGNGNYTTTNCRAKLHKTGQCFDSACEPIPKRGKCAGRRAGIYCLDEETRLICPDATEISCPSILTTKKVLLKGHCQPSEGQEHKSICRLLFADGGPCQDKTPGTHCSPAGRLHCNDDGSFAVEPCKCNIKTKICEN